jgi:hypothetical protein
VYVGSLRALASPISRFHAHSLAFTHATDARSRHRRSPLLPCSTTPIHRGPLTYLPFSRRPRVEKRENNHQKHVGNARGRRGGARCSAVCVRVDPGAGSNVGRHLRLHGQQRHYRLRHRQPRTGAGKEGCALLAKTPKFDHTDEGGTVHVTNLMRAVRST